MKIEALHIGEKVRHPQSGAGAVKTTAEPPADTLFDDGSRRTVAPDTSGLQPAEAHAAVTGLDVPLSQFIKEIVAATVTDLGLEKPDSLVDQLGARWHNGRVMLHPADASLHPKEVPLEAFFHKIVMMRNNLPVLEQKINGHEKLSDGEKVEMQQYITRCYGSMTTFNILFKNKEDQFGSGA